MLFLSLVNITSSEGDLKIRPSLALDDSFYTFTFPKRLVILYSLVKLLLLKNINGTGRLPHFSTASIETIKLSRLSSLTSSTFIKQEISYLLPLMIGIGKMLSKDTPTIRALSYTIGYNSTKVIYHQGYRILARLDSRLERETLHHPQPSRIASQMISITYSMTQMLEIMILTLQIA